MKVKLKKAQVIQGSVWPKDSVLDLDNPLAELLIGEGYAEAASSGSKTPAKAELESGSKAPANPATEGRGKAEPEKDSG